MDPPNADHLPQDIDYAAGQIGQVLQMANVLTAIQEQLNELNGKIETMDQKVETMDRKLKTMVTKDELRRSVEVLEFNNIARVQNSEAKCQEVRIFPLKNIETHETVALPKTKGDLELLKGHEIDQYLVALGQGVPPRGRKLDKLDQLKIYIGIPR
ncbi:hypothetical protein F4680DRAFT_451986 [Xylaria scruposa]|nr:hypothetical protein F4680DRAFT_451986 [Xylaria scruposa]